VQSAGFPGRAAIIAEPSRIEPVERGVPLARAAASAQFLCKLCGALFCRRDRGGRLEAIPSMAVRCSWWNRLVTL